VLSEEAEGDALGLSLGDEEALGDEETLGDESLFLLLEQPIMEITTINATTKTIKLRTLLKRISFRPPLG
jgi:hypothetical protein